ncbi:MAG: RHS repeat-associated core domain-containing protein, partial [Opitutales bacterium]
MLPEHLVSFNSQGAVRYIYDDAGRLVSEQRNGKTVASYEYGFLDKVTSVTRNGEVTNFHYNARGMLVAKERDGQIVETFGWDGIGLVAKGDTVYANEAHVSGGVPLVSASQSGEGAEASYYDSDYLGTTTASYEADGDVNIHEHTSYGQGIEMADARFTGKHYDADLGAHVFPYRNYRSDVGRWASADPAGFPDGPNKHYYAPVPTMGLDPLGLYIER